MRTKSRKATKMRHGLVHVLTSCAAYMALGAVVNAQATGTSSQVRIDVLKNDSKAVSAGHQGLARLRATVFAEDGSKKTDELDIPDGAVIHNSSTFAKHSPVTTGMSTQQLISQGELSFQQPLRTSQAPSTFLGFTQCDTSRLKNWHDIPKPSVMAQQIRDTHDATSILEFIFKQNRNERQGYTDALVAFSGLLPQDIRKVFTSPDYAEGLTTYSRQLLDHQDWYEPLTAKLRLRLSGVDDITWPEPAVQFSKEQLHAFREAFLKKDGLILNGGTLLGYPDRLERNEKLITDKYLRISKQMAKLTGNEADWSTFAVWASDVIGRELANDILVNAAETIGSNPRYWFSLGNAQLASQLPVAYVYFITTFINGANRDLDFETFWQRMIKRYAGYGIVYIDGDEQSKRDVKNAFYAYYESMKLYDLERSLPPVTPSQVSAIRASAETRAQYMAYGNFLAVLTEQRYAQPVLENATCVNGVTNPLGVAGIPVVMHLPGFGGTGDRPLPAVLGLPNSPPYRINFNQSFIQYDGTRVWMAASVSDTLNGLKDPLDFRNKYLPESSATTRWDKLGERMAFIYQFFVDYQHDVEIHDDPRVVYGSRAKDDVTAPIIDYSLLP